MLLISPLEPIFIFVFVSTSITVVSIMAITILIVVVITTTTIVILIVMIVITIDIIIVLIILSISITIFTFRMNTMMRIVVPARFLLSPFSLPGLAAFEPFLDIVARGLLRQPCYRMHMSQAFIMVW